MFLEFAKAFAVDGAIFARATAEDPGHLTDDTLTLLVFLNRRNIGIARGRNPPQSAIPW